MTQAVGSSGGNDEIKGKRQLRAFGRFSLLTLIVVYVLILIGGIVRSTGSGMGCPDWPKCFGSWVPPTDVSQLPDNYQEIYSEKRAVKNKRFAAYLAKFGFEETAERILNDQSILEEAEFNKVKTSIEYINRLFGVLTGFFIMLTFFLSIKFIKRDPVLFAVALSTLVLVIFQGWFGSIVVSTNLVPWTITVHMILALVIVALLVYLVHRTGYLWNDKLDVRQPRVFQGILLACMIFSIIQIILGTQVREAVDVVAAAYDNMNREVWIEEVGQPFIIHRSFSWLILLLHFVLAAMAYRGGSKPGGIVWLLTVVVFTVISGILMAHFAIPAALQPVHLLLGSLVFGIQFLLFLQSIGSERKLVIGI